MQICLCSLVFHDFKRHILQFILQYSTVLYRIVTYLVARVTLSMSLNVSPIFSFVRPVTTIYMQLWGGEYVTAQYGSAVVQ